MPKAVFDATILVGAFLRNVPGGASHDLLRLAHEGAVELFSCGEILEGTARVLLHDDRKRQRYTYSDADVVTYCQAAALLATIVHDLPEVHAVGDSNDDMIVACALAANADYIVTRGQDLLSLATYQRIEIVPPETLLHILRRPESQ